MALPQRTPSWHGDAFNSDELCAHDEPLISVRYPELFGVDEPEDSEPWCVDRGDVIDVMSTARIREAIASGELSRATKVWRDGSGFWLPIAELSELVGDVGFECEWREPSHTPDDETGETAPEQSCIRRRPGASCGQAWDRGGIDETRRSAVAVAALFKAALVALALVLLAGAGTVAARMVAAPVAPMTPLRCGVAILGERLDRRDLTIRIQPFPRWRAESGALCTFAAPPAFNAGRHQRR